MRPSVAVLPRHSGVRRRNLPCKASGLSYAAAGWQARMSKAPGSKGVCALSFAGVSNTRLFAAASFTMKEVQW